MRFMLEKNKYVDVNPANINCITYDNLTTNPNGTFNADGATCTIHFTNGKQLVIPTDKSLPNLLDIRHQLGNITNYNNLELTGISFQTATEVLSNLDENVAELMSQIEMVKDAIREFIPRADSIDKSIYDISLNIDSIRRDMNK